MKRGEPSVLDYFKSLFSSTEDKVSIPEKKRAVIQRKKRKKKTGEFSLWALLAFIAALVAQGLLEPPVRFVSIAFIFYSFAFAMAWFGASFERVQISKEQECTKSVNVLRVRALFFVASLFFLVGAFWAFGENEFNWVNLILWLLSFAFYLLSVWQKKPNQEKKQSKIDCYYILLICVVITVIFFRVYNLEQIPGEMFSDHAEKLLDIADVLDGYTPIFFTRNTGREALQFYLTAAIIKLFNTGLTFISLKIGMVLAGILTLPYIYLMAKEFGDRWTALLALFMAGVAYWPNVISRVALRFALYPLFAAPMLYYLLRGLRTQNRNDFLLSGIALGLGLHGYSPARFLPLVVITAFFLNLLQLKSSRERAQTISYFFLVVITSFIIFLPLFRFAVENYDIFSYRAISRLLPIEKSFPGSPVVIFFSNLWNAITMFFYSNGEIWVHSIPNRPALDILTAASFFIGVVIIIKRYLSTKDWADLFILLAIPLLMMPSILSLNYPGENPSLNRTSGAYVCVFVISAIGFASSTNNLLNYFRSKGGRIIVFLCVIGLLTFSAYMNLDLVLKDYNGQFLAKAWNSTELAKVIIDFIASGGDPNNAYVVPYPHWVDTRLVGINAGFIRKDYALWPDKFKMTLETGEKKIFILKPEDKEKLNFLLDLYPQASINMHDSARPSKDFIILFVPPR